MHLVIFEGSDWGGLAPLALSRPTFTLFCGMSTLLEKQLRAIAPTRLTLWVRPELAEFCRQVVVPSIQCPSLVATPAVNQPLDDEPALLESGRVLHFQKYDTPEQFCVSRHLSTGYIRQAYAKAPGLSNQDVLTRSEKWLALKQLPETVRHARFAHHPWDLIDWNEEAIIADSMHFRGDTHPLTSGPWHLVNPEDVLTDRDVKLHPGCVIDASKGPVAIGKGAVIGANAVIQGPCYIGPYTEIQPLAHIRPGVSIGPRCKIGGEVSNSIIIGHANKSHDGYLGDSYIGEWVNLGAGTTTSNLKNTYGTISMPVAGKEIDTGRRYLGSVVGDHSKTAIATRLMSGTYLGFSSMLASSTIPPRFVPSYRFITDKGNQPYRMDKASEVAKAVFARRNRQWLAADEELMQYVAKAAPTVELATS
jgi:UDP-N-acetylglucosamine diphosphorylase/glucosamine-1-phosphate N-acetyltransferase